MEDALSLRFQDTRTGEDIEGGLGAEIGHAGCEAAHRYSISLTTHVAFATEATMDRMPGERSCAARKARRFHGNDLHRSRARSVLPARCTARRSERAGRD